MAGRVSKINGVPPEAPTFTDVGFPSVGSANGWSNRFRNGNFGPQKDMTSAANGLAPGDTRMSQTVSGSTVRRGAVQWFSISPNTATINE